jgi:hypothetical protein
LVQFSEIRANPNVRLSLSKPCATANFIDEIVLLPFFYFCFPKS